MKIAIPTKEDNVDDHFGHCSFFTIYTIDNGKLVSKTTMNSPQGCGCKSNLTELLKAQNVNLLLAGNMGEGAVNKIKKANIDVIRGCSGTTDTVIQHYLKGVIFDSGLTCVHHSSSDSHTCNH